MLADLLAGWGTELGHTTLTMIQSRDQMNSKEVNPAEVLWTSMGLLALRNSGFNFGSPNHKTSYFCILCWLVFTGIDL